MAGAWAAASSLLPSQTPPQPPRTPLSSEPLLWNKEGKEEAAEAEREREQGRSLQRIQRHATSLGSDPCSAVVQPCGLGRGLNPAGPKRPGCKVGTPTDTSLVWLP